MVNVILSWDHCILTYYIQHIRAPLARPLQNDSPTNQTSFVKKTSCTDVIFSFCEIFSRLTRGYDRAYACFFDLPLMLKRAFDCGINGNTLRILKS